MNIESYSLVEHFDYMKKYIPQPFNISSDSVVSVCKAPDDEDNYIIKTTKGNYCLSRLSLKKLSDSLGVKVKLLSAVCDEVDVIDLALPIINKLFKCFADCFVFYATSEDAFTIIDLNVNNEKGEEGTKYENGPSPWKFDSNTDNSFFTCFADFLSTLDIKPSDTEIQVMADDIMSSNYNVTVNLFIPVGNAVLQPMISFSGKFSDMDGFSHIHTALYDPVTKVSISFPMNYAKLDGPSFNTLWKKALHLYECTDLKDYISREISELGASDDTPKSVRKFISDLTTDSELNLNQSIEDIITEANTLASGMRPSKANKFKKALGSLIGWCIIAKHTGCEHCGHIHVEE